MGTVAVMTDTDAAILFDIDGTLVDSTYHHAIAWQRAFGRGPLERAMNAVVRPVRRAVAQGSSR